MTVFKHHSNAVPKSILTSWNSDLAHKTGKQLKLTSIVSQPVSCIRSLGMMSSYHHQCIVDMMCGLVVIQLA